MTTSLNVKEQRYYILFSIVSGTLKPGAPLAPLKPGAPLAQLLFYPPYRVCITSGWKDPPFSRYVVVPNRAVDWNIPGISVAINPGAFHRGCGLLQEHRQGHGGPRVR